MKDTVITTKKLSKAYHGIEVLKGIDMHVPKHAIVGFLGPNGAGKSTTINCLLGLIKPTSGHGEIFGLDIIEDSLEIRQKVGFLAQHPKFYPNMTPREILRFIASFYFSGPQAKIEQRISDMLELVGLSDKADRIVRGFSGGELQRLGIAQAQINFPDLLILDEPAAALDPIGRQAVLEIMEKLKDQTTIFFSTHILDDVQKISDWVVILNEGKIRAQGPIEQIMGSQDNSETYLLETIGAPDWIREQLEKSAMVRSLSQRSSNGVDQWDISIHQNDHKKRDLLELLLANKQIDIQKFTKVETELEDVFIKLVKDK